MKRTFLLLTLAVFVLSSCKTTYLKQSTNVSNVKKSYEKILVVSKSKDQTARIKAEQQVVKDLGANGVKAESSMQVIKMESFDKQLSEAELDALREAIIASGYDAIIITTLINAQEYTDVIPGSYNTGYYPARYGRWGRYYSYYPATYWEPDRIETGVEYTVESCLYDLTVDQGDNLQWVGRFQLKDPSDLMKTIEKLSLELVTELMVQNIEP